MDRRSFLASLAGAASAFTRRPEPVVAAPAPPPAPVLVCQPGAQLHTVRDLLVRDFEGTLARIAEIGFREVEFAGYFSLAPGYLRRALAASGLTAPCVRVPLETLGEGLEGAVEIAVTVGHQMLVASGSPGEAAGLDAYLRLVELLNRGAEVAMRSGIRLAYHTRENDFRAVEGRVPLELLWEQTEPGRVVYELDVYQAARAGADPLHYLERLGGAVASLSLTDAGAEQCEADLGEGGLELEAILAAARAGGVRHCFVARDDAPAPLDSLRAGFDFLQRRMPAS